MDDNPYQSPQADLTRPEPTAKAPSHTREELRQIAVCQKGIIVSIVVFVVVMLSPLLLSEESKVLTLSGLAVGFVGAVFGFLLGMRAYGTGVGILLGLLSLVPCFGIFILLVVSDHATVILKDNGIKVGLFGARLSDI